MIDPRPDLSYDSPEWSKLLTMAEGVDKELAGVLDGFRSCGLRLHRGREGWSLRPDLDPNNSKWLTKEGYLQDRDKWLMPYQVEIVNLLQRLE